MVYAGHGKLFSAKRNDLLIQVWWSTSVIPELERLR
jgi:hypothetical protein